MSEIDIVELIETNPVTKLSDVYQHKLLSKLQCAFTGRDQQLFLASFFCYLNYNSISDFVIDLDNIWEWLGFTQKVNAKRFLENHFTPDVDINVCSSQKKIKNRGEVGITRKRLCLL